MPNRLPNKGFTLVELIITLTIAGILAAVALPAFQDFIRNERVKSASFDLMTALTFARSEAIKRNTSVDMIPSGSGWKGGWDIKVGTTLLRNQAAFNGINITDSNEVDAVTYRKDGRLSTEATNFTVFVSADTGINPRCITIDLSGRPNSKKLESGTC